MKITAERIQRMKDNPLVSVYTCVYNGEHTIHRVFESMKKLDYPNIEHVIVNDGSTDQTDALVQEYIRQVSFPVKYHKKENGGKHTALNVAWDLAEGKFLLMLDADDELLPDSARFLVDTYYSIPEDIRDQYWYILGRCITQHGEFLGDKFPENINAKHWTEAGKERQSAREKKLVYRSGNILRHTDSRRSLACPIFRKARSGIKSAGNTEPGIPTKS